MNYDLLAITMATVIAGLGYLVKCVHRQESGVARMQGGLRRYVRAQPAATRGMSS
jgi:hypothetical protein